MSSWGFVYTDVHLRGQTHPNPLFWGANRHFQGKHAHTQPFYGSMGFVRDNPGELIPEETFTHSHLLWLSIAPYLLHPSNMIHGILPVQSMHLTVFFDNLSPSFLWSTSWPDSLHFILHTFLHPIFFSQHKPVSVLL